MLNCIVFTQYIEKCIFFFSKNVCYIVSKRQTSIIRFYIESNICIQTNKRIVRFCVVDFIDFSIVVLFVVHISKFPKKTVLFFPFNRIRCVKEHLWTKIKMPCPLAEAIEAQRIWTSKAQYADAEQKFHAKVSSSEAIFSPNKQNAHHSIASECLHCLENCTIWEFKSDRLFSIKRS